MYCESQGHRAKDEQGNSGYCFWKNRDWMHSFKQMSTSEIIYLDDSKYKLINHNITRNIENLYKNV